MEHHLSALLQLHLSYLLNTWIQWIGQRQLHDQMRNISVLEFGAAYIRDFTVYRVSTVVARPVLVSNFARFFTDVPLHDDIIKWKLFPRHWPFVRGIHRSLVNFPHKGQ